MKSAGGDPDALPEEVGAGQQATDDSLQGGRRNPAKRGGKTIERLGHYFRNREYFVEAIALPVIEGANRYTKSLASTWRFERRVA